MGKRRSDISRRLSGTLKSGRPIQGICVSCGLTAKAAEKAGADFLVTYAGAMFRREGVPASLCELCYDDCNTATKELGRNILPRLADIPLIGGIGCLDPYEEVNQFIDNLIAEGFSGVANLPGIGDWEGEYREMSEQLHMGYDKEVEMIRGCHARDIFTLANCYTAEQAVRMTDAGADVVCIDMGATGGGLLKPSCTMSCGEAAEKVAEIADCVRACANAPFILFHGGPFATAEDMDFCLGRAAVHGVFNGSAAERIPVERAVMDTVAEVGALHYRNQHRKGRRST